LFLVKTPSFNSRKCHRAQPYILADDFQCLFCKKIHEVPTGEKDAEDKKCISPPPLNELTPIQEEIVNKREHKEEIVFLCPNVWCTYKTEKNQKRNESSAKINLKRFVLKHIYITVIFSIRTNP
jgi:hypothetical protein